MGRKKKPLPELKSVTIESVAAEGKAVVKVRLREDDEKPIVVFIPYGAPGDIADVQIDRKKHSFAEGRITRLLTPSDKRTEPKCRHFSICGGCKWQHLPYEEQLKWKQRQVEDALTRIAKVRLPEICPILRSRRIWEYRNKMEYTFSNKKWRTWEEIKSGCEFTDSSDALGFHIPGAFDKVLHIQECMLQDNLGNRIRNYIYKFAIDNGLPFYDIRNNQGLLRTLMIRIASTGDVMVCVVFGENDENGIMQVMESVKREFPEITSLQYIVNMKVNDSVADQKVILYAGRDYIEEEMEGLRFRVNTKSFYQTNSLQAYELYKVVRMFAGLDREAPSEERPLVYDLYTGTGTIANFVSRKTAKVIGIEYVEEAIADAKVNAKVNGLANTEFYAGDMKDILTDEFVSIHGRPQVMIIDPPGQACMRMLLK